MTDQEKILTAMQTPHTANIYNKREDRVYHFAGWWTGGDIDMAVNAGWRSIADPTRRVRELVKAGKVEAKELSFNKNRSIYKIKK